jgi:hypothetical protein
MRMTSSPWFRAARPLLAGLLAALAALAAGCAPPEPSLPAAPSYAADVRPIFVAHCVRCHGAGGALNVARDPHGGADAGPLPSVAGKPALAYLGQYADSGDCADPSSLTCHRGAYFVATQTTDLKLYLHPPANFPPMPPPPSPRLDDWELKVVDAWLPNPLP